MTRLLESLALALGLCALLATGAALARTSDRNQPMDLFSDSNDCNIEGGTCHFIGDVKITQGSLDISAARAEIHRANGKLSSLVLTGSPVVLKQVMDDGTSMTAHASKVDYNLDTDTVVFTGNVEIKQPRGILNGERVVYNMTTGQVRSGGQGNGRVRMRIIPNNSGNNAKPDPDTRPEAEPDADADVSEENG